MRDPIVSTVVNGMLIVTGLSILVVSYALGLLDPLFK